MTMDPRSCKQLLMIGVRTCRTLQLRGIRYFSSTDNLCSGHNRWSKIKHDKAKVDATVTKQRSGLVQELQSASKQYGADPKFNPRLANIINSAKKQGLSKISIEGAIARGQGRSATGAALESVTIEAMLPPSVAVIMECQTDSKARTLNDIRLLIKECGGTATPTSHMFDRKGKIVLEGHKGMSEEEIFDQAIEAGAIDVQMEEDGRVVVYAEYSQTKAVADALAASSGLEVVSSDIIWDPKDDMMVDVASPEILDGFLERVQDDPSVQDVYTNAI